MTMDPAHPASDFDLLCSLYDRTGVKYEIKSPYTAWGENIHKAVIVTVDHECDMVDGYSYFESAHAFDENGNLVCVFIGE